MDKEYYLFVEGKKVVVSKEVYLAYHSELNKEKYQ
ncbi:MAG: sigma-70 family RNA polymerase sigma factor, partial [Peptoniphilus harei]|nr:sigma-70 family RNA polymerase sigma factor [Peptoniphilus harei]